MICTKIDIFEDKKSYRFIIYVVRCHMTNCIESQQKVEDFGLSTQGVSYTCAVDLLNQLTNIKVIFFRTRPLF